MTIHYREIESREMRVEDSYGQDYSYNAHGVSRCLSRQKKHPAVVGAASCMGFGGMLWHDAVFVKKRIGRQQESFAACELFFQIIS